MARQGVTAPPEQVAIALAARELGASHQAAADLAGVSEPSVIRYEKGQSPQALEPVSPELVARVKAQLFHLFSKVGVDALTGLEPKDWATQSPLQRVTGAAIATDKIEVITGVGRLGGVVGEPNALDELIERPGGREVIGELLVNMSRALSDLAARPAQQVETIDVEAVSLPSQGAVGDQGAQGGLGGGGGMEGGNLKGAGGENQPDDGNHTQQH